MTKDQNKHITSITYNHLNLPLKINFDTGSYITYLYDATGVKIKKTVYTYSATAPTSAVTEYLGTFQYRAERKENSRWLFLANEPACRVEANGLASEVELQFIFTAEGYYNVVSFPTTGGIVGAYVYNYTDHLGNIRLSYTLDQATQEITPLEEHHYYPFGMEHKYYNSTRKTYDRQEEEVTLADGSKIAIVRPVVVQVPNSGYQYQYQSQERQDELGLNWDSFKWRNYDYAIGRFMSVDPLAEKYAHNSTYAFSENRVVDAIELEGLEALLIVDKGNYLKGDVGHTFVSVGSGNNQTVYTYGRWAGADPSFIGNPPVMYGSNTPLNNGDGVMVKLTGDDARTEIQRYVNDYGAQVFEITTADESKVQTNLETEFNKSTITPDDKKYKDDDRAHVIDKYDITENNCTTKSLDAMKSGMNGKNIEFEKTVPVRGGRDVQMVKVEKNTSGTYAPRTLSNQLNDAKNDKNSGVKEITDQY